jgi:hypothetical protein
MTPALVTYLVTAKRTEKRKQKQQIVAIQQTVADAVQENKAGLVQSY